MDSELGRTYLWQPELGLVAGGKQTQRKLNIPVYKNHQESNSASPFVDAGLACEVPIRDRVHSTHWMVEGTAVLSDLLDTSSHIVSNSFNAAWIDGVQ